MGNCQAVDAAALVIQHPSGKTERHYWPISARDVMKSNPGYYVSIIIPLPAPGVSSDQDSPPAPDTEKKTIRYTRVKLLRPTDTLLLGHAYRLITSQEVMKVLKAKKNSKTRKSNPTENISGEGEKSEKGQVKATPMRPRSWRPSLQSISEATS